MSSVKTMKTNGLVDVAEVAHLSGVPAQTVRRYAKDFSRWIPTRTIGRKVMFAPESVSILQKIRSQFEQGATSDAVKGFLASEAHAIIDIDAAPQAPQVESTALAMPSGLETILAPFLANWERQNAALETLVRNQAETLDLLRRELAESRTVRGPRKVPLPKARKKANSGEWTRERIFARVRELEEMGLAKKAIARKMEADGVPTISGSGRWGSGTVRGILSGRIPLIKPGIPTIMDRIGAKADK